MKKVFMFSLMLNLTVSAAEFDFKSFGEKIFGKDLMSKVFGKKDTSIMKLPEIPEINKDSKSLDVYKEIKDEVVLDPKKVEGYNIAFVKEVVRAVRNIDANRDDISKWYNTLAQGGNREGVYRALVSDDYYRRLENYDERLTNASKEFSVYFFKKYFAQEIKIDDLADFNVYTLTRIMTEKALDISDSYIFGDKKDDFFVWYSVLSSELSKDVQIWENRLRNSSNPKTHLAWTKKVPLQFIKSELVIKIHMYLHHLQTRSN